MLKIKGSDAFAAHTFLNHGIFNKVDLTILGVWDSIKFKKTLDAISELSVTISKDFQQAIQLTKKSLVDKFPELTKELTELFNNQNLFMVYNVFYEKLPVDSDDNTIYKVAQKAKPEIDKAINELKEFWATELNKEYELNTVSISWDNEKLARAVEAKLNMNEFAMIAFLFEGDVNKYNCQPCSADESDTKAEPKAD